MRKPILGYMSREGSNQPGHPGSQIDIEISLRSICGSSKYVYCRQLTSDGIAHNEHPDPWSSCLHMWDRFSYFGAYVKLENSNMNTNVPWAY